jgi:alkyl sulfatase BDS1-like metallo-beta-lactamase superfamily hydrolase
LLSQTLTNIEGFLADDPDLSITINRSDLEQTMMGAKKLVDQIADVEVDLPRSCGQSEPAV